MRPLHTVWPSTRRQSINSRGVSNAAALHRRNRIAAAIFISPELCAGRFVDSQWGMASAELGTCHTKVANRCVHTRWQIRMVYHGGRELPQRGILEHR